MPKRGGTYQYRIVPMGGTPGQTLTPLSGVEPLLSNKVTLTPAGRPFPPIQPRHHGDPGAEQSPERSPQRRCAGAPLLDPNDPIRIRLMGQLQEGVTSLLARADKDGGIIHGALYELNDPNGLGNSFRPIRTAATSSSATSSRPTQTMPTPTTARG